jgi:hypothetical protein
MHFRNVKLWWLQTTLITSYSSIASILIGVSLISLPDYQFGTDLYNFLLML